jgi:hypothetical protein
VCWKSSISVALSLNISNHHQKEDAIPINGTTAASAKDKFLGFKAIKSEGTRTYSQNEPEKGGIVP